MKISLFLSYHSKWGEELFIVGDIDALKGRNGEGIPLEYAEDGWKVTFYTNEKSFKYNFYVRFYGERTVSEAPFSHEFRPLSKEYTTILIYESFVSDVPQPRTMTSAVMSKAIRHHKTDEKKKVATKIPVIFHTHSTSVNYDHELAILGNDPSFGRWNEEMAVTLNASQYPSFWQVFDAQKLTFPLEYKYVIKNPRDNSVVCWEKGENHIINPDLSLSTDLVIVNDSVPQFDLPDFKGAGTAIPVFSLRTKESFGVGEFNDLKKLAQWCSATKQRLIQTLPINDTTNFGTWRDSYPYSAISVYALHPMFLNIEKMGKVKDPKLYTKRKNELNDNTFVDYELVNKYKWEYFHELYDAYAEETFASQEYKKFFKEHEEWLKPYAVFSFLRHKFNTADFNHWGKDSTYIQKRINDYCKPSSPEYHDVAIHFYVQFHLNKQLKEAVEYAHSIGIALKGDLPIGVSAKSVDVWQHPDLFDCEGSAGAPPDYFSRTGQVWGFPIYNWHEMAKDDFRWWRKRLSCMSEYFDAFRIDHILGFFRIFRAPRSSHYGLVGQFAPALPLTIEEIEKHGIQFDTEKLTQPIINQDVLDRIFGQKKAFVISHFLYEKGDGTFRLKPQFATETLIDQNWSSLKSETEWMTDADAIRKGLYLLCCQVLFVEDYKEKGKYHPRITLMESEYFPSLPADMKEKMRNLYEEFFFRRHNEFWREEALQKLGPLLNSTDMMVCGEDLGMVPQCVGPVMKEMEILSLEIQRMPKEMYVEFGNLSKMPYLSVCTTSTHDMSTIRLWWEKERGNIQHYFSNELHQFGSAPLVCLPWIAHSIVENHLKSPAMWVILPLQDWMAIDGNVRWSETEKERINDPGNPDNYWRYRMHLKIEDLLNKRDFNDEIKNMVTVNNR